MPMFIQCNGDEFSKFSDLFHILFLFWSKILIVFVCEYLFVILCAGIGLKGYQAFWMHLNEAHIIFNVSLKMQAATFDIFIYQNAYQSRIEQYTPKRSGICSY